ncbi:biotin--[acetyl-CoA-carboxylase] ligase [Treponema sp.]|uniref:biotin--[acetyl-CoA-carboxylase] ligase n=1 Tax=Treponema sp. TaxID=166 RepID=UPI00298DB83B|nr:biotin--[acetyl-CoA-carboxylase] ligase [Treponema sp.]MCQ2240214.1 biotin--[acetyl-CoA-carboxylase] ligase [Treponema sp.]
MVNKKPSTKSQILQILRTASSPINGDTLANETGVSRVAVWKAVQSLQLSGYKIDSARNGYQLSEDLADSLYPWEFGMIESSFSHFAETDSTMIQGRIAAEECKNGELKVITADIQNKGQGHADHKWTTTRGSLACTIVSKESISLAESHRFVMACQIAAAKALQETSGRKIFVRWPNDIWTEKGKAGGILDDLSSTGSFTNWINLGLGLNLSVKPKLSGTDFIFDGDKKVLRKDILKKIIENLKAEIKSAKENNSDLEKQWNLFCPDIGKSFKVKDSEKTYLFKGINSYGWAVTECNGQEKSFPPCTINFIKSGEKLNELKI